jgi:putative endonuclease
VSTPIPKRHRRGRRAETIAAQHVLGMGMRVLERNLRVGYLEIDILARDGDRIVVIEVRTRGKSAWQAALDTVTWRKRERLRRAAAILWSRRWSKQRGIHAVRFDVVGIDLEQDPPGVTYVRAAFT